MTIYDPPAHVNHVGHWDANGGGDWHCSEHRQPGCTCIAWRTPDDAMTGFGLCADCTHVEEDHVVDPASRVARCAQCRDEYVPTRIIRHAEDDIECPCGNRPHLDGFVCCSAIGVPQEGEYGPTPDWDGDTLACLSCKRVFSTATLAILPFYLVESVVVVIR